KSGFTSSMDRLGLGHNDLAADAQDSIDGQYLLMNIEKLCISSLLPLDLKSKIVKETELFLRRDWVVQDMVNVLYLPYDYRQPKCVAVYNNVLVMGYLSGHVSI